MNFFCVYVKNRKKVDKYFKNNRIRNKYVLDLKQITSDEELCYNEDKTYLKIVIFNKIKQAIEKGRDIYYIPNFDEDFSIDKLLNLKKMLGKNNFNILIFYNEFRRDSDIIEDVFNNLSKFDYSQIIRDY